MANPLTIADDALYDALRHWNPLVMLVPRTVNNITADANVNRFDRTVDARQIDNPTQLTPGVWIVPTGIKVEPFYGGDGGATQLLLSYQIGYQKRSASVENLRLYQYEIIRPLLMMSDWLVSRASPAGLLSLKTGYDVTPFEWIAQSISSSIEQREPVFKTDRWKAMTDVTLQLLGNTAAIYSA